MNFYHTFSRLLAGTLVLACLAAEARTYELKPLKRKGGQVSQGPAWWAAQVKTGEQYFLVKIGAANKADDTSPMEIRAATVFKGIKNRQVRINDIVTYTFEPTNTTQAVYFGIKTGTAFSRTVGADSSYDRGWTLAGCTVEYGQAPLLGLLQPHEFVRNALPEDLPVEHGQRRRAA